MTCCFSVAKVPLCGKVCIPASSLALGLPLPPATFIRLFCVLGIDEPVQDVVLLGEGEQKPHDLFGIGIDVEQSFHQAGLPSVGGCQLVHEEVCRQSQE